MSEENQTTKSKGSYFRPPTSKPYAWLIYLYMSLYLGTFAGDLGKVMAIIPWITLIVQLIVNLMNLFRKKLHWNLKQILINILLFVILGFIWEIFKQ